MQYRCWLWRYAISSVVIIVGDPSIPHSVASPCRLTVHRSIHQHYVTDARRNQQGLRVAALIVFIDPESSFILI